jgi:hypothetical protein
VGELRGARNPGTPLLLDANRAGLVYLDGERLIVHETDLVGGLSSPVSPDVQSAFHLHAFVLDAHTGIVIDTKNWPTRSRESSIAVSSGAILVRTGEVLRFFSKDFEPVADVTLAAPARGPAMSGVVKEIISTSVTGKTILVNAYNQRLRTSNLMILDGQTLKKKFFWSESPPLLNFYTVSDSQIAVVDKSLTHLEAAGFGTGDRKPFGDLDGKACRNGLAAPVWATEDSIMVPSCRELLLVSAGSAPQILDKFANAERHTRKIVVSQDGKFAALVLDIVETKHRLFAENEEKIVAKKMAVYSLALHKRILTIPVTPIPEVDFDFAISPNGSQLAVLTDRRVSVYAISNDE